MTREALQEAQTRKISAEAKLLEVQCLERIQRLQRRLGDDKVNDVDLSFDDDSDDNSNAASVEPVAKKCRVEKAATTGGKNKVMLRNEELIRLPHTARFLWRMTEQNLGGVRDSVPVPTRTVFEAFDKFDKFGDEYWGDHCEFEGFFDHIRCLLHWWQVQPEYEHELDAAVHGFEGVNRESELVFDFAALRWRIAVLYLAPAGARPF
eukprot:1646941-Rhodomonas_salina.1